MPTTYHFSTASDKPHAVHLLVYFAQQQTDGPLDFTDATRLGGYAKWSADDEDDLPLHWFQLGVGEHSVGFEGAVLTVKVTELVADTHLVVYKHCFSAHVGKHFSIAGVDSPAQMQRLLQAASQFVSGLLRNDQGPMRRVVNYVYDAKDGRYMRLGYLQARDRASLFLKHGETDALFGLVERFLGSKADYERCSVPYKLNILLHGVPGGGKTSVITAIASHFGLNVAVVPYGLQLTDDTLAKAILHARQLGCRVVVLEDVDCLFEPSRKIAGTGSLTLSGLLNCMDGLMRGGAQGMVMVLTANLTDAIDEAVLRTARVDFSLLFTHADRHQTRQCFEFYSRAFGWAFTAEEWEAFWESISCHQFTTAMLQQHFFRARDDKAAVLDGDGFKRLVHSTGKEATTKQVEEKRGWFYN